MLQLLILGASLSVGQASGPPTGAGPNLGPPPLVESVPARPGTPLTLELRPEGGPAVPELLGSPRPGAGVTPGPVPRTGLFIPTAFQDPAEEEVPEGKGPAGEAERAEASSFPLPLAVLPQAEEEQEPEDAAHRWLLMKTLQGTWMGWALDGHRMQVYGWVAGSYTASSAAANNTPVVWNYKANEFLLNQAWLRIERTVDTSASLPTFGFRSDWLFGTDYAFTLQRNLFDDQLSSGVGGGPNRYGVDPITFYANAFFPGVAKGLEVRVGRYWTPFGVESLEAVSSPTVSKSYAFNYCPPFTHTGVYGILKLSDQWTTSAGVALGNDIFFGEATEGRFIGTLSWTQPGGRNIVTFGTSLGRGSFMEEQSLTDPATDESITIQAAQNHINVFDLVWNHVISARANYTFEAIYGYQNGYVSDDVANKTVHWASVVNYLFYSFNPKLSGMARFELFDDFQGARTGYEGLYAAGTLGATYRIRPGVILRPELRYDYNFESRPFEDQHDLLTAAAELILRW